MYFLKFIALIFFATSLYSLELERYIAFAKEHNPIFKKLKSEIEVLKSEIEASRVYENPKLTFGINGIMQDYPLDRDREPLQNIYLTLSQKIDINGKNRALEEVKATLLEAKIYELKSKEREMERDIALELYRYISLSEELKVVLHHLKNLSTLKEQLEESSIATSSIFKKIFKIELILENLKIRAEDIKMDMELISRGVEEMSFAKVDDFDFELPNMSLQSKEEILVSNYELRSLQKVADSMKKREILAQLQKIPDPTISVGYFNREKRDDFFGLSVTVPLQIFGKESLDLDGAKALFRAQEAIYSSAKNRVLSKIDKLQIEQENLLRQIELIRDSTLPNILRLQSIIAEEIKTKESLVDDLYLVENEYLDISLKLIQKEVALAKVRLELYMLGGEI